MTKAYPATVSRTLDPEGRGFLTVLGQHDRRLTDADINLIQDVQDLKHLRILDLLAPSGCVTLTPFVFSNYTTSQFAIPKFSVLFRGNVVTIDGFQANRGNRVVIPYPQITQDNGDAAAIFVVFLELWGKALEQTTGEGYHTAVDGKRYVYPGGCVQDSPDLTYPDDTIDPFQSLLTTLRVQLQWRLRVEKLPLDYEFNTYRAGLDPVGGVGVPGWGSNAGLANFGPVFQPLGSATGEPCLWGATSVGLKTVDGWTYAMPLAVVFQRNRGNFHLVTNPLGCSSDRHAVSGMYNTLISGRLDGKFADVVYPEDVVDTRLSVSLHNLDYPSTLAKGMFNLMGGRTALKIARGSVPGNDASVIGSRLDYFMAMSPTQIGGCVDTVGAFDGWANGFSSDTRTFSLVKTLSLADRTTVGTGNMAAWGRGDVVPLRLGNLVASGVNISSVFVQSNGIQSDGSSYPLAFYGGQLQIHGLLTKDVIIEIVADITALVGNRSLIVSVEVTYPAGGLDLRYVPQRIAGGTLYDASTGVTMPVVGVSDYEACEDMAPKSQGVSNIRAYSPLYSADQFGLRVFVVLPNTGAHVQVIAGSAGDVLNRFTVPRMNLDGMYHGFYVVGAKDASGKALPITYREIAGDNALVSIQGTLPPEQNTVLEMLCLKAAIVAYNAPVKGVTALEETVLAGSFFTSELTPDPRLNVVAVSYAAGSTSILIHANGGLLRGFSGDDLGGVLVWKLNASNNLVGCNATCTYYGGLFTIVVPTENLTTTPWLVACALKPALTRASQLVLNTSYLPYQGEGVLGREYEVIHASDTALITTNGTGKAPIPGIADVYPMDRQQPIVVNMPSLQTWVDADLKNQSLSSEMDSNYVGKRLGNIEHTLTAKLHTNDFIPPLHGDKRKRIKLIKSSGHRGFIKTLPHIGFAIVDPKPKTLLGDNLQATVGAITLYVHNVTGSDSNDGLSRATPKKSIGGALVALPPVLRHPVAIYLVDTGAPYLLRDLQKTDFIAAEGATKTSSYYCLGKVGYVMQNAGRLVIGRELSTGDRIIVDATGFVGFGAGAAFAFLVEKSSVCFSGMEFQGFTTAAVKVIDSEVELSDCAFSKNLTSVSAEQSSVVTISKGVMSLGASSTGVIAVSSSVIVAGIKLQVIESALGTPDAFFVAERNSSLNLSGHNIESDPSCESGVTPGTVVAKVRLGSNVVCDPSWITNGQAKLQMNSVLMRNFAKEPFRGKVDKDSSSTDSSSL